VVCDQKSRIVFTWALLSSVLVLSCQIAFADSTVLTVSGMVASSTVDGVQLGAGDYTSQSLLAAGSAAGTVTADGVTGIPLWSLLGGDSAGNSDVVTSTPSGDNGKNAILRSYVMATSVTGIQSIVSLGEIDPFFVGTASVPAFIALGADGRPELVFPGANASGRNVVDLESVQVLAAPALPTGDGGVSTSLALTGNVLHPGNYTLADLQALPSINETVSGDTYTGIPLWTLLNTTSSNVLTGYVLAGGTDGYEVLYSLAELDPALGAPQDLVPYTDTQGQFPSDGLARIIIPGDNHAGRYVSNLDFLEVVSTPEPGTAFLVIASLAAIFIRRRPTAISDVHSTGKR